MVRLLVLEFQSCCPKPIWAIALKSLCAGIVFWHESSRNWGFQCSFFFYSLAHSLRSFAREGTGQESRWLLSLLLSCRVVVGRAVSWRIGADKLEPLLQLNTSTYIFSLFFSPSPFPPFRNFCASRNLFLLFFSSPFLPFQVDSTKTRQTWVSVSPNLKLSPHTHT